MLFGDDALYYQIVRDAHDRDPAVAWRHSPFRQPLAWDTRGLPMAPGAFAIGDRLGAGLRALVQRVRPQPLDGSAICCGPAC